MMMVSVMTRCSTVVMMTFFLTSHVIIRISSAQKDDALRSLAEEFWLWKLNEYPEWATAYGWHQFDRMLESYDYSKFDSRWNDCNEFLARARSMDRAKLTSDDRLTIDVLLDQLTTFMDGYRFRQYGSLTPVNFLEGVHRTDIWVHRGRFVSRDDYDNYVHRLHSLPKQIEEMISLMQMAIARKVTNHQVSMRGVTDDLQAIEDADPDKTMYFDPVRLHLDKSDMTFRDRQQVRDRVLQVIEFNVQPAYSRLRQFIDLTYIPATRADYGVWSLTNGTQYYRAMLKWHLSVDMDPDEIHKLGLSEVHRIETHIRTLMEYQSFTGSLTDYYKHVRKQSSLFNHTEEKILDSYKQALYRRIQPRLPRILPSPMILPNISIERMKNDGIAAQYKKNTLVVNTHRPHTRASYDVLPIALHEGLPGHHLQISLAAKQNLPDFHRHMVAIRKYAAPYHFPYYTAYVEGWGLYAEYLGEYMGIFDSPYEHFGRYSLEMLRACRLVVDTGIHYKRWSRDQAVEFMANYTTLSADDISVEVDRYITWPGQACAYKIGELKIKQLKDKAKKMQGSWFDIRRFHSRVLSTGPVPLVVLEKRIDDWLDQEITISGATTIKVSMLECLRLWLIIIITTIASTVSTN